MALEQASSEASVGSGLGMRETKAAGPGRGSGIGGPSIPTLLPGAMSRAALLPAVWSIGLCLGARPLLLCCLVQRDPPSPCASLHNSLDCPLPPTSPGHPTLILPVFSQPAEVNGSPFSIPSQQAG